MDTFIVWCPGVIVVWASLTRLERFDHVRLAHRSGQASMFPVARSCNHSRLKRRCTSLRAGCGTLRTCITATCMLIELCVLEFLQP